MDFTIDSKEAADAALEYFNAFHDGLMQRIVIESRDSIGPDGATGASGLYDITIRFGHYNYPAGRLQPYDRAVVGTFSAAQDLSFDFAAEYLGSPIIQLSVDEIQRRRGGTTTLESALSLRLGRHLFVEDQRRFEYTEQRLFSFTTAEFAEE